MVFCGDEETVTTPVTPIFTHPVRGLNYRSPRQRHRFSPTSPVVSTFPPPEASIFPTVIDGGFVTYDNPDTVKIKATFCKQNGPGGLFYWSAPSDSDMCGRESRCQVRENRNRYRSGENRGLWRGESHGDIADEHGTLCPSDDRVL
ncbi:hypothetical protein QBC36DRAFT_100888 [Triangularia setosa]|uniref:Uncharacterized protein n=1 Tax=Triangularia setosa TaxID=2587417 RepID=A0AAN6VYS5_9PEZI|nr:hypothetical protein QBC36DRAFT_100888 [Podospora setosa]